MPTCTVRDAVPADAPRLQQIHAWYIEHTAVNFNYDVPSAEVLAAQMRLTAGHYPFLVAEEAGEVCGYACAGPFVGRTAYQWSAELTIYLDPDRRSHGLGRALYEALEARLAAMGIRNLYACIGVPSGEPDEYLDTRSRDFHAHMGFTEVGHFTRCGSKFGRWYDMIWMEKVIGPHEPDPEPVHFPAADGHSEEYFDVCSEDGLPTGQTVSRDEAHREGILHRTSHVWIVRETAGRPEILLQKRSADKDSYPGCYDTSSAGHIPAGCEPLPSALRELAEELGVHAGEDELLRLGHFRVEYEDVFHGRPFHDNEYANVFLLTRPVSVESLRLQEEEIESVRWFGLAEVIEATRREDPRFCINIESLILLDDYLKQRRSPHA